jgi:uncharacterized protein YfkK (UPF0435 family)
MEKDKILKNGNSTRLLKLLLKMDTFSMDDYKLIIQNDTTRNVEYIVPLIKYKFGIDPPVELMDQAKSYWKSEIAENIDFDISKIYEYMNICNDQVLSELISRKKGGSNIVDNSIFDELVSRGYDKTIKSLIHNYGLNVDDELFEKILTDTVESYSYCDWNITFVSKELLQKFIKKFKLFNKNLLNNNTHLLNSKEEYEELYEFLKTNKITRIDISLGNIKGKYEKEILKIYLLQNNVNFSDLTDRINKYPDIWKDINFANVDFRWEYRQYFDNIYWSSTLYYNIIIKIITNIANSRYTRFNYSVPNKFVIYIVIKILLTVNKLDKNNLDKILETFEQHKNNINKNFAKDTIDLINSFKSKLVEPTKIIISTDELPIID